VSENAKGYSVLQVSLHWVIVLLVLFQLLFGESMTHYVDALEEGGSPDAALAQGGHLHLYLGLAILALAVLRLALRFVVGVPAPVPGRRLQVKAGEALHWLFYVLLFAMPVSGLFAYNEVIDVGELHAAGQALFWLCIVLHVAAALYHHFLLRDSTLMRMLKPGTV
jgi:cytochrome b561